MTTAVEQYYRLHSKIYDATRWSFLFGRSSLVAELAEIAPSPSRILEIGCGTGKNIAARSRRFPEAGITGVDLSEAMLALAKKKCRSAPGRIALEHRAYDGPVHPGRFDLVVCAYSLSMFNPGWQTAIACAFEDLAAGGVMAVVDFHDTRLAWFKNWMRFNHVRMAGHLFSKLAETFVPVRYRIEPAYLGIWQYFRFFGRKP